MGYPHQKSCIKTKLSIKMTVMALKRGGFCINVSKKFDIAFDFMYHYVDTEKET